MIYVSGRNKMYYERRSRHNQALNSGSLPLTSKYFPYVCYVEPLSIVLIFHLQQSKRYHRFKAVGRHPCCFSFIYFFFYVFFYIFFYVFLFNLILFFISLAILFLPFSNTSLTKWSINNRPANNLWITVSN